MLLTKQGYRYKQQGKLLQTSRNTDNCYKQLQTNRDNDTTDQGYNYNPAEILLQTTRDTATKTRDTEPAKGSTKTNQVTLPPTKATVTNLNVLYTATNNQEYC